MLTMNHTLKFGKSLFPDWKRRKAPATLLIVCNVVLKLGLYMDLRFYVQKQSTFRCLQKVISSPLFLTGLCRNLPSLGAKPVYILVVFPSSRPAGYSMPFAQELSLIRLVFMYSMTGNYYRIHGCSQSCK